MTKHINGRATGRSQVVRVRGLGFSHTLCLCLWLYGFAPGDSVLSLSPAHTPHSPVSLSAIARARFQPAQTRGCGPRGAGSGPSLW